MPASTTSIKQSLKTKYGGRYALFSKDDKTRRRRKNVTSKEQQPKINTTITKKEITRPTVTSFDGLISELDYSYDSLATINVIFDSLLFTYTSSKDDIEQHKNQTRLGDMEKELLAAYDDLCLQISHLEKHINKMETQFEQLKTTCSNNSNNSSDAESLSSPSFPSSSSTSSVFLESDLNHQFDLSTFLLVNSGDSNFKQFEQQPDSTHISYY